MYIDLFEHRRGEKTLVIYCCIGTIRDKRKQAAAMPRNDASFAIFTFALQIRSCNKHAVAFVTLPVTREVMRLTSAESSRIAGCTHTCLYTAEAL